MEKILVVDDDTELCDLVMRYLSREGFAVEAVNDGARGVERATSPTADYSLIVLDVMLPRVGGFDVLRRVREKSNVPVLMLTARGDETDRIVGLEIGADDYLPKPFNPRELSARIRAVLRRSAGDPNGADSSALSFAQRLKIGDVEIDFGARLVKRDAQTVELTGAEFDLLAVLLRRAGQVVTREELVRTVLSRPLTPYDRSIDTLVSNLRRKLGHEVGGAPGVERLKSVRGTGYVYARPSEP